MAGDNRPRQPVVGADSRSTKCPRIAIAVDHHAYKRGRGSRVDVSDVLKQQLPLVARLTITDYVTDSIDRRDPRDGHPGRDRDRAPAKSTVFRLKVRPSLPNCGTGAGADLSDARGVECCGRQACRVAVLGGRPD